METQSLKIVIGGIREILEQQNLLEDHWQEVAKNKHLMKLKPDVEKYLALESSGSLLTIIAYENETIVGYSVNIITPHLHYSDLLCCYNDVLFLAKEKRNSPLGLRLIARTEEIAKDRGVKLMLWHVKENTSLAKILPRKGCKIQELIFSKEL